MKNYRLIYLLIAILVVWNIILTSAYFSKPKHEVNTVVNNIEVDGFSTDFTNVISDIKSSNVLIKTETGLQSGFVYKHQDNKVYILTAGHGVINENNILVVFASGETIDANLIGNDVYLDLAVLEIETDFIVKPIKLANSSLLKDGEFVVGIGTPNMSEFALSTSLLMVSSNNRLIENSFVYKDELFNYYLNTIQLSGLISKGYSGAGVFNMAGELAGMITMSYEGQEIFAVTSNEIKLVVDKIIDQGVVARVNLGVKGHSLKDLEIYQKNNLGINLEITNGYYVSDVKPFSIAERLGIKHKDIIVSINDKKIVDYDSINEVLYSDADRFNIEVIRNSENINFELVLTQEASDLND